MTQCGSPWGLISPKPFPGDGVLCSVGLAAFCWPRSPGCQANATKVAPAELPVVPVSQPIQREVTDYVDFTGRTEAVYSVDIRPRVTGYLGEMPFEEGAEVKAGDLLFVVDPRPTRPSSTRPRARSISTRPRSSWPRPPSRETGPSTRRRRALSASSSSIRSRPW